MGSRFLMIFIEEYIWHFDNSHLSSTFLPAEYSEDEEELLESTVKRRKLYSKP